MKVLLVEDNPGDVVLIQAWLEDAQPHELTIEHAGRLSDALARLAGGDIDAVLLDLSLPDSFGLETVERVRAAARRVPIVVLTGRNDEMLAVAALRRGAQDYLVKESLVGSLLVRAVRYAVERENLQLEREREAARAAVLEVQREAAEEAVRARDEFLSVSAHELRTPMTSLRLAMQQLRRNPGVKAMDETALRMLELSERQVERMGRLIEELLDISRIHAGRLTLELDQVDLTQIVLRVADWFSPDLRKAGCELRLCLAADATGQWDATRIEQVVTNLVSNALKYGRGKPIAISVERDGDRARLWVEDEGIGIDPDRLEAIFERFERAVSSSHYAGLGLGLYIVKQLVEAHDGTVRVTSAPGKGSKFVVELPCAAAPKPARPGDGKSSEESTADRA